MNVVLYLGGIAARKTLGVAHFVGDLVHAVAARPDTAVTLLGEACVIGDYKDLPEVRLVDEANIDAARSSLTADNDLLVQVHQFQPRLVDLPTVLVVHDVHVYDARWMYPNGSRASIRSLHKNLIRADAVVSYSPYTARRVSELEPLASDKVMLTVCPSLLDDFELDSDAVAAARQRHDLDGGRPTILCPATRQPHKNHWNLLTALGEIRRDGYDVRLICAGGAVDPDDWAAVLDRRVDYLGLSDVGFLGQLPGRDLRALYHLATAVVSPSLVGSGAYAAQAALGADRAVICSAIPGALAHLERMQLDIPTFDPYDIDAIAAALKGVLDDAPKIVADYQPARQTVADWTWNRLADEVVSSLDRVVDR